MKQFYIGCDVDAVIGFTVRVEKRNGPTIRIDTGSVDVLWGNLNALRVERSRQRPPPPAPSPASAVATILLASILLLLMVMIR